jgi:hypothetical protein
MALEAEKATLTKKKETMELAALSAPAPEPSRDVPLKIGLFPWYFWLATAEPIVKLGVNERFGFKYVLEALYDTPGFSVSHSYYDYDPPPGATEEPIDPLKLSQKEAKGLWKKDGLFSRSAPSPGAARLLGEKTGFNLALFICSFTDSDVRERMRITMIDVASGEATSTEKDYYYLTYEETVRDLLEDQLKQVLKNRDQGND